MWGNCVNNAVNRVYLLFRGEYQIYFIMRSTSENYDVCNSRDEIYSVLTEKSKFSFYVIFFFGNLRLDE